MGAECGGNTKAGVLDVKNPQIGKNKGKKELSILPKTQGLQATIDEAVEKGEEGKTDCLDQTDSDTLDFVSALDLTEMDKMRRRTTYMASMY